MEKVILNLIEDKYYGSVIELGQYISRELNIDTYGAMGYIKTLMADGKLKATNPGYFSKV